jgi:RNase H-like domain found in reverse transcriptase
MSNLNGSQVINKHLIKSKRLLKSEVPLAYPDFNKPFHIYTDASNHQLGAVVIQDKKPIAFIQVRSMQPNEDTQQQNVSCYLPLKTARNIKISCWDIQL